MHTTNTAKMMLSTAVLLLAAGTGMAIAAPSYQTPVSSNNSPSSAPAASAPSAGTTAAPSTAPLPPAPTTQNTLTGTPNTQKEDGGSDGTARSR
jgi:hypothetical protein